MTHRRGPRCPVLSPPVGDRLLACWRVEGHPGYHVDRYGYASWDDSHNHPACTRCGGPMFPIEVPGVGVVYDLRYHRCDTCRWVEIPLAGVL